MADELTVLMDATHFATNESQRKMLDCIVFNDAREAQNIFEEADHSDLLGGECGARILLLLAYKGESEILQVFKEFGYDGRTIPYYKPKFDDDDNLLNSWSLDRFVFSFCPVERIEFLLNRKWLKPSALNFFAGVGLNDDHVFSFLTKNDDFHKPHFLVQSINKIIELVDIQDDASAKDLLLGRLEQLTKTYLGPDTSFQKSFEKFSQGSFSEKAYQYFMEKYLDEKKRSSFTKNEVLFVFDNKLVEFVVSGFIQKVRPKDILLAADSVRNAMLDLGASDFSEVWKSLLSALKKERPLVHDNVPKIYQGRGLADRLYLGDEEEADRAELWIKTFSFDKERAAKPKTKI